MAHIVSFKTGKELVNYLDDFLFVAFLALCCNRQLETFLEICKQIRFPVSEEKTFWVSTWMTFLGMLLDTVNQTVSIPVEKISKAKKMIGEVMTKKKLTVNQLQKICGILNFLGRAVLPGRVFTRCLYSHLGGKNANLKPFHHLQITRDMREDLQTWDKFLNHPSVFCRKFLDFTKTLTAETVNMYSDAMKKEFLGFGAICKSSWMYETWDTEFLREKDPSIEFLELFGVVAGVITWIHHYQNRRIVLFCDNQSVVSMINNMTSSCRNCMVLLRVLVLKGMTENVRIFAKHIPGKFNKFSDWLSRGMITRFKDKGQGQFYDEPTQVPTEIWPVQKIWLNK